VRGPSLTGLAQRTPGPAGEVARHQAHLSLMSTGGPHPRIRQFVPGSVPPARNRPTSIATQQGLMVTFVTAAALSVLAATVTSLLRGR
jgi:hypothetical protein